MTDQCGNCMLQGDFKACQEAPCYYHDNWYAVQMRERIQELEKALRDIKRHQKIIGSGFYESTGAWQIANKALQGDSK